MVTVSKEKQLNEHVEDKDRPSLLGETQRQIAPGLQAFVAVCPDLARPALSPSREGLFKRGWSRRAARVRSAYPGIASPAVMPASLAGRSRRLYEVCGSSGQAGPEWPKNLKVNLAFWSA